MAWINWFKGVIVTNRSFTGYYQTMDYGFWKRRGEMAELVPVTDMQVKAEIAQPVEGETVPSDSNVRVHGAAWTSDGEITKVEVSTNGGASWNEASLIGKAVSNAWRLWDFEWDTPSKAGKEDLIASATDSHGCSEAGEGDPERGSYMINQLLPITVEVR